MENTNEAFVNELGRTDRSTDADGLVGKDMLGGFYAIAINNGESKSFPVGVDFKCGPGKLKHPERITLWEQWLADPESIKKLIGKCRHFPVGVKDRPRHPRWIGWSAEEHITHD
jgi:DNA ligase-1